MVIIGAGHAAVRAALAIRTAGFEGAVVMIAEQDSELPYERPPCRNGLAILQQL